MLRKLRTQWGEQSFDSAWRAATSEDTPEWFREAGDEAS
jgi:hypothetical protein